MHHERTTFKRDLLAEDWERDERRRDREKKPRFTRNEYDPDYDKTPRRTAKPSFVHKCVCCGARHEGPDMKLPSGWKNTQAGIQCGDCATYEDEIINVDEVQL